LRELKKLADGKDSNAEAAEWLRRARVHIETERQVNAPALVYARQHWAEMARSSQGDDEGDYSPVKERASPQVLIGCDECVHYKYEEDEDGDDEEEMCARDSEYFYTEDTRTCPAFVENKKSS
jgi:hypothetical protein